MEWKDLAAGAVTGGVAVEIVRRVLPSKEAELTHSENLTQRVSEVLDNWGDAILKYEQEMRRIRAEMYQECEIKIGAQRLYYETALETARKEIEFWKARCKDLEG